MFWKVSSHTPLPGNTISAIGDIRAIAKLTNGNTAAYLKLAHLHYRMGEEEESLKLVPRYTSNYGVAQKTLPITTDQLIFNSC